MTRQPSVRLLAVLATASALTAQPPPAAAKPAPEPLPYTSVAPANGSTIVAHALRIVRRRA